MEEIWKVVPFNTRYEVSNLGRVRGGVTGGIKKNIKRSDGYIGVGFYSNPFKSRVYLVHRLVLLSFIGSPPTKKHQAAHWDGNKENNILTNLRWATQSENNLDKKRHGTFTNPRMLGEANHKAKLTEEKVRQVRQLHASGHTIRSLSRKFNITYQAMKAVVQRKHWAHVI